ncbi:MAG: CDP-alcohol phosphatidyltransferase family protein [Acidobacteria bacterium]|nr:CDP-alcohol phosphatidyltransferase family protein [Acidobacteriota bacterium]
MATATGIRTGFTNALRIQESFTASLERKALRWLAQRMPPWVNSDHLTALGFAAQLGAGATFAAARWNRSGLVAAIACIALNWFGDSLDGTVARLRNRQRPRYGFYVDHMVDSFGASAMMAGLAISGFADWRIAAAMLVAFLLLSIEAYLATYTLGSFRLSYGKFGPTEIRLLLIAGCIRLMISPYVRLAGHNYRLFDIGGAAAAAGMLGMCLISAVAHTRALYRQEKL